jgi:hypothetical protein
MNKRFEHIPARTIQIHPEYSRVNRTTLEAVAGELSALGLSRDSLARILRIPASLTQEEEAPSE